MTILILILMFFTFHSYANETSGVESNQTNLALALTNAAIRYGESCESGSESGCSSLATMYKIGIGVEKNQEKANDLMEKASLLGLYKGIYSQFSEVQKEYLAKNYKLIRRITQAVLDRYGHARIPADVIVNDRNMIEFDLHPNGSISNISFVQKSKIEVLNDTTRETIELAYSKYPRPKEKILIRYRIRYDLDKNESKKEK
ncbi:MAG TPA: hypothetical protein VJA83_07165 [Sulfuricurvum sp.]|nr:hypothetical protein [Sulfuricurvum sp.]